jgi:3-deoxy-D-manno-octulosonic-acid transferase
VNAALGLAYGVVGWAAERAALAAAYIPGSSKLARTVAGRRGVLSRYASWAAAHRDPDRQLLWFHASSVGEGLQARPLLELIRQTRPALQIAYTFFSSSAEPLARHLREQGLVDFSDYLPWDTRIGTGAALDKVAPRVVVFSKLDVWPNLVREAKSRGVRLALISGTLPAESVRLSRWGKSLLGDAFKELDAVGAIDSDNAARLSTIGVRPQVLRVTGDTRYDQVWAVAHRPDRQLSLAPWRGARERTLVAGSTWPADERELLAAWLEVRKTVPGARLIIAPHEPTPPHLGSVERWAASHQLNLTRLGRLDAERPAPEIVLVDRVGILADLYSAAQIAFVGGGFHDAGLHSVLEPAAFGVPVLFGPNHASSRDAIALLAADAGAPVRDESTLRDHITAWLADDAGRGARGERARAVVQRGLGAAARSAEMVLSLI